jgi:hypothetical protein
MRAAACLQFRQQVAYVRLDRLFTQEEALPDLAVHKAVRDQLQNLNLAIGGFLFELVDWRLERDDGAHATRSARSGRLEAALVIHVPAQDLVTLCSVHEGMIGLVGTGL